VVHRVSSYRETAFVLGTMILRK